MTVKGRTLGALVAILIALGGVAWWIMRSSRSRGPIRLARSDFQAQLVETVLNESARRVGISIEWVPTQLGVKQSLASGVADGWAAAVAKPELREQFYVSATWTQLEYALVAAGGFKISERPNLRGVRVAYNGSTLSAGDVEKEVPGIIPHPVQDATEALRAVCKGEAEAAYVSRAAMMESLLRRPVGCEHVALEFRLLPEAAAPISIVSTREAAPVAQALRAEIGRMAEDGALTSIFSRILPVLGRDGTLISSLADERQRSRFRLSLFLVSGVVLLAGVALLMRLRAAMRAAEQASKAKSDFVASVSHEIRTPLNGIMGMADLLIETRLSDLQREFAETIRSSASALLTIIGGILDFSKIEAGKRMPESAPFSPRETVEDTVAGIAALAHQKDLEVASFVDPSIPSELIGDAGALRQVLTNLLSNAVKFTYSGSVVTRVSAKRVDGESAELRFEVTDTGIGIESNAVSGLFKPFSQADSSTTRRFGGTGLGLAISKRLVEMLGGTIGLRSAPGEGSVVEFTARFRRSNGSAAPVPCFEIANMRVLAQVRTALAREMLAAQLAALGVGVEWMENAGLIARRVSKSRSFDAVILEDWDPALDLAGLPAALLITHERQAEVEAARAAGIAEFLFKPVRLSSLTACLARLKLPPAVTSVAAQDGLTGARAPASGGRILVVEDNPVNQKVARHLLSRLGYQADIVENGAQAVQAAASNTYRAVLMDCYMPEMDGFEAAREIRRLPKAPRRPAIIALTASVSADDMQRCRSAGMDDYLAKPIDAEKLRRTLERWCSAQSVI